MATSGQLNTNTAYESYFWVKWSQASQDIAANKTKINWSCGVYCGHNFYLNAVKMSAVSINGVQVYGGGTYSNYYSGDHTIASGTLDISHGTDGKKTFSISPFTGWLYSNYNYSSNGKSYELTTIPRKATITAAADFTDVDNPSISFSNPGGLTMDVWLEPNPVGDHLCVRNGISNTGKYTWTLTEEERDQLRSKCAGKECTIRLGLYTHIGNTTNADYVDKKFTMTDHDKTKPSVEMSVTPSSTLVEPFKNMYIQGKSKVDADLSRYARYGASIKADWIKVEGVDYAYPHVSAVLSQSGTQKIQAFAQDSRGFVGYAETNIYVFEYSKPVVSNGSSCYRSDENGKKAGNSTSVWLKAGRSYSSVEGKNTCSLLWRFKESSKAWSGWEKLLSGDDTTTDWYDGLLPGEYDKTKSYTVQVKAVDSIGEETIKIFDIPTEDVALHLGKGGKNVSVGSYCDYSEDHTFSCSWKAIFKGDVEIKGMSLKDYILSVINGGG